MSGSQSRNVQVNIVGDSSKLQSATKKGADSTEAMASRIGGAMRTMAGTISSSFGGALEPVMSTVSGLGDALDTLREKGVTVGKVMLGIGSAGVSAGVGLSMLGSKEQQANQQLSQAFTDAGQNLDDYKDRVDSTVGSMAKYGYTSDQVKDALAQLVTATKDPTKSLNLMQTAADLAATKHESLSTAVSQLTQIVAGKGTRTLQSLGIQHLATANAAKIDAAAQKAVEQAQQKATAASAAMVSKLTALGQAHHATKADVDAAVTAFSDYEASLDANGHATSATTSAQAAYDAALRKLSGSTQLSMTDQLSLSSAQDKVTASQVALQAAYSKQAEAAKTASDAGGSVQKMLAEVSQATRGQASAAADTFSGRLRAMRAELENTVASIGQKYGPALQGVSAGIMIFGGVTETVSGLVKKFTSATRDAAAGEMAKKLAEDADAAATKAATAAEIAEAPAEDLALGPILLIIAAVAALGVGIYELVTHWKQVWGDIKAWTRDGYEFIREHWYLLMNIPVIGWMLAIALNWKTIWNSMQNGFNHVIDDITGTLKAFLSFFEAVPYGIEMLAVHMFDGVGNAFRLMIDFIVSLWNDLANETTFTLPKVSMFGVTVGGQSIGPLLPTLPTFADGGIATSPMLAVVGDNRARKEAIVPLEKAGQFGFGGGDLTIEVPVYLDSQKIGKATARHVRSELGRTTKRNGRSVGLS